jgi:Lon-like ATP-dependent protease
VEEGAAQIQVVVTPDNLHDFVGKPLFPLENMYARTPPGVVMGLAWNSMGGTTLYIEAAVASSTAKPSGEEEGAASNGDGGLFVTGQLGDVMKESAQIAYTVAKRELRQRDPKNDFFARNRVHLHVPEGGTPKDGPSAGVSMTTALLSLAEGRAATADVALTGEISLTGKVLPVGGIKEKVIAARRSHVTRVVLPAANRRDFEELPVFVTEGLNVDYAHTYSDVYRVLLGDQPLSVPVHTPPSHAEEVKEGKVVHNLL